MRLRRILSIDGGGVKGIFPLSFLASIEGVAGGHIGRFFDLVVGSSTGGIIALGLGLGYSARDLMEFYEAFGPAVFGGNRFARAIGAPFVSQYDARKLRQALEKKFGTRQLGSSFLRLVIPALDLERGRVHLFKTAHHPRFERDYLACFIHERARSGRREPAEGRGDAVQGEA